MGKRSEGRQVEIRKDSTPRAAQQQREGWWTCMLFSTEIRSCASMQKMRTSMLRKTRMSTVGLRKVQRYHARGGRVENPWWKPKRQVYGRRKAAKKFNEFVVTATDGLGIEQCPEQPSLFRRPGTTLIFECPRVREQCGIGMAPRESGCKAQAEAGRANGSGVTIQLPPCVDNED